jgi:ABC-type antimicrobial peptide transport system permease subunit
VTTHLPITAYSKAAQIRSMYLRIAIDSESLPGVRKAGVGTEAPLGDWEKGTIIGEHSASAAADGSTGPIASQVWVTGHYLEAVGVRLVSGRFFNAVEFSEARGVVVISESLAKILWPGEDAVGRRLGNSRTEWATVVGVVSDVKEIAVNSPSVPQIYEPHSQLPDRLLESPTIDFFRTMNLDARSSTAAESEVKQLALVLHRDDPALAIAASGTLVDVVNQASRPQRLSTFLISAVACVALLLAIVGVASVLGYSVAQRRHEIGIRMALGSQRQQVLQLMLVNGLRIAAAGIALGLVAAMVLARLMTRFLFAVRPIDPATLSCVAGILLLMAIMACYFPAKRASQVDPAALLR